MPKRAENPLFMRYNLEMELSPKLSPYTVALFQSIICILRWMVELGKVNIITGLTLLSSYLASPREGHLDAAVTNLRESIIVF